MARPRSYVTAAAKQAAYRERKRRELELSAAEEAYAAAEIEIPAPVAELIAEAPASLISEADYVEQELAITLAQMQGPRGLPDHDGQRLERSERYARWRYRAFQQGEVASL